MPANTTVLIVATNAAERTSLQGLLRQYGFVVLQVSGMEAALEALDQERPKVVVAAARLGRHSGLDLLRAIRARTPATGCILFGSRAPDMIIAAFRSGADDYLMRPIAADELARACRRATDLGAARQEQLALASTLQHASLSAQGRLAASLAHEINNPLTPMLGMAELLLDDLPPEHVGREYATTIIAAAQRIHVVTRSLVDFVRVASQDRLPQDVGELLRSTLLLVTQQLHAQGISLTLNLPDSQVRVLGSSAQLKHALLQIIENAREAMPQGGQLQIRVIQEETCPAPITSQRCMAIIIRDTGQGISAQHLPHIFELFFSTKTYGHGVGLGLASAYSIVTAHSGVIEVSSMEGEGSSFRIVLPLYEP